MSIPANPNLEASPYGAQPVLPVGGPQGGPYLLRSPQALNIIGSASRTAGVSSGDVNNYIYSGLYLYVVVTVNPGGAQTLQVLVEGKDGINGNYHTLLDTVASATPGGVYLFYPGAGAGPVGDVLKGVNLPLPGQWRVRTVHSAAGAWTYSINAWLLP